MTYQPHCRFYDGWQSSSLYIEPPINICSDLHLKISFSIYWQNTTTLYLLTSLLWLLTECSLLATPFVTRCSLELQVDVFIPSGMGCLLQDIQRRREFGSERTASGRMSISTNQELIQQNLENNIGSSENK